MIVTENSMERRLLDLSNETLIEILRRLPKDKLFKISKLCSKLRDLAGDKRLWKNVNIKYEPTSKEYDCDELYSEPWPVKEIDMSGILMNLAVPSKTDQIVKVTRLKLSSIIADEATMEVILSKYQCKELYLDFGNVKYSGHIMGIAPETFSKQTALEFLSLKSMSFPRFLLYVHPMEAFNYPATCCQWLAPVLSNCKNLKTLDLSDNYWTNRDMLDFAKVLPKSLEKLCIANSNPENSFFDLLAKSAPNLRVLGISGASIIYRSVLKLNFLEVLHISPLAHADCFDITLFYPYIEKFSALKAVYIMSRKLGSRPVHFENLEQLRTALKPHGIILGYMEFPGLPPYVEDGNVWKISNAT